MKSLSLSSFFIRSGLVVGFLVAPMMAGAAVPPGGTCYGSTSVNLSIGVTHSLVINLQKVLNNDLATQVASSGAGSPGQETNYFGTATQAAVKKFQTRYGVSPTGTVGPATRAKLTEVYGCSTTSVAASIAMSAPTSGAQIQTGSPYTIRWNTTGAVGKSFDITVLKNGVAVTGQRFTSHQYDLTGDGLVNQQDVNSINAMSTCPADKRGCDMSGDGPRVSADDKVLFSKYISYDYNNDGNLNKQDSDFLELDVIGGVACPASKTCDLDGDGGVYGSDATTLRRFIESFNSQSFSWNWNVSSALTGSGYTIRVEDRSNRATLGNSGSFSISTVASVTSSITVSAPLLGTQVQTGSPYTIRWDTSGATGKSFDIILMKGGAPVAGQRFTTNTYDLTGDGLVNQQDVNFTNNLFVTEVPCPADKKGCDMSGDGPNVSSADVVQLINYVNYDLNSDGNVNQQDVGILNQVVAGTASCPAGKTCDLDNSGFYTDAADTVVMITFIGGNGAPGTIDYNGDGKVDQTDLASFRNIFAGGLSCPSGKTCDINRDGTNGDASDVVTLINYVGDNGVFGRLDFNNDGKIDQSDVQVIIDTFVRELSCPSGKFCDLDGSEKNSATGSDVTILLNFITSLNTQNFSWDWSVSPTLAGSGYTIRVEDVSNRSVFGESGQFSISTLGVSVTAPAAGARLREGRTTQIKWSTSGLQAGDLVEFEVRKQAESRTALYIKDLNYSLGSYTWTIAPAQLNGTPLFGSDYFIRANAYRNTQAGLVVLASSDSANFTVEQKRIITVSTPTNVFADTLVPISWTSQGIPGTVSIRIVTSAGAPIVSGGQSQAFGTKCVPVPGTACVSTAPVSNTGSFTWRVPEDVVGNDFRVYVYDDAEPVATKGFSNAFSIGPAFDRYDLNNDKRTDHLDRAIMRSALSSGSCGAISPRTCDLDRNGTSGDAADVQTMTNRLLALYDYTSDGANEVPDGVINQKDIDWFNLHVTTKNYACPSGQRCDITVDGLSFQNDDLIILGLIAEIDPKLTLIAPNAGELLYTGSTYPVQWNTDGAIPTVSINLLQNGVVKYTVYGPGQNVNGASWNISYDIAPGKYDIEVRSNAAVFDMADQQIVIDIPRVDPLAPAFGSSCEAKKQCVISWNPLQHGALATDKIHLSLMHSGSSITIADVNNSGSHQWTAAPITLNAYGTNYKIGFDVVRGSIIIPGSHTETGFFEVAAPRTISIIAPTANGKVERGKQSVIQWDTTGAVGNVRLIIKKGTTVILTTGAISQKQYTWDIPNNQALGGDYTVRVESIADTTIYALSNNFSIVPKPAISVRTPNGGEEWAIDDGFPAPGPKNPIRVIKWTNGGIVGPTVDIQLIESTEPDVSAVACTSACDSNGDGVVDVADQALANEFKKYDINNDGRVDRTDQELLINIDDGGTGFQCPVSKNCDINGDGSVDGSTDVTALVAYANKMYDINKSGAADADDIDAIRDMYARDQVCDIGQFCDFNGNGQGMDSGDVTSLINYIAVDGYTVGNRAKYDLTLDGKVDQNDVTLLNNVVAETAACPLFFQGNGLVKRCDLNGDGEVFGNDVTLLLSNLTQQRTTGGDVLLGVIASGAPNNGQYSWTITNPFVMPSSNLKVAVVDPLTGVRDESDSTFTIREAPVNLEIKGVTFPGGPKPTLTINDKKPVSVSGFVLSANNKSSRPANRIQIAARIIQGSGATAAVHVAMDPISIVCASGLDPGFIPAPSPNCNSADPSQIIYAADSDQITGRGAFVEGDANVEFQLLYENRVVASKKFPVKLVPKPEVIVVSPNGGESWTIGGKVTEGVAEPKPYEIKWRSRGLVGPVDISLVRSNSYTVCGSQCDVTGDGVVTQNDQRLAEEFRMNDVNNDGRVDKMDRDFMLSIFNESGLVTCPASKSCDLNRDGGVGDSGDLVLSTTYINKLYDINRDGVTDENDIDAFREIAMNERPCALDQYCDFNSNGSVDSGDVVSLTNYIGEGGYSRGERASHDINLDGVVNQKDAEALTQVVGGEKGCPSVDGAQSSIKRCDLNGDGVVLGNDVTILQNLINQPTGNSGEGIIKAVAPNKSDGPEAGQGGKFLWFVRDPFVRSGDDYKIMIKEHARPTEIFDDSDQAFSIVVPPPKIITPTIGQSFMIDPALQMKVNATHPMGLTRYRVRLVQNNKTLYDSGVNTPINVPITFDKNTCAAADSRALYGADGQAVRNLTDCVARGGHRLLDQLREGKGATGLRIVVEGALMDEDGREVYEYTPSATRVVELKLNREAPNITSPTANQEVALAGKTGIVIGATHKSQPAFYDVILKQNGRIVYEQDEVEANGVGVLKLTLTRETTVGEEQLFKKLDTGQVELLVRATLIGGEHTAYASRIFVVIPLPADYDLNDDGEINTDDFQILNGVVIFESRQERVKPIEQRSGRPCPKITRDANGSKVQTFIAGKELKFDKNCNLTGDKDPSGRDIIDSLDLAAMKSHPAFEDNTESFGRVPGIVVSSPMLGLSASGEAWMTGTPEDVVIQPYPGATGYLVGFIKGGNLIFENYRDMTRDIAKTTVAGPNGTQIFRVPDAKKSLFTAGNDWQIWIRALVKNQWTDATVIPLEINATGVPTPPPAPPPEEDL
jgi:peptidoglycan hydrolase-like protein with peptidoglycan-binding domain